MRPKLIITCLLCLNLLLLSCKKGTVVYRAQVIAGGCSTLVLNVDGNNNMGTAFQVGTSTFNNAVNIANFCYAAGKGTKIGDIVTFTLATAETAPNPACAVVFCLSPTPDKSIYINDLTVVNP